MKSLLSFIFIFAFVSSEARWQSHDDGQFLLRQHLVQHQTPRRNGRALLSVPGNSGVGVFETLNAPQLLASHPHIFATIICEDVQQAGVTVLHESLLRAGHREPLLVLASPDVSDGVRVAVARLPLVRIFRAENSASGFCALRGSESVVHNCSHLKLLLFALKDMEKVVFLEHDTVVLNSITKLIESPPFSAVREPHVGLFETSVMVIRPDMEVYNIFREQFCSDVKRGEETSDHFIIRTVVPDEVWTTVSDTFNVPQEHMDTLWYRKVDVVPAVIHYKGIPKPWNWWRLGSGEPMSLDAFGRWCNIASETEFACAPPKDNAMIPPMQPSGWSNKNRFTVILSTYHRPTWKDLARYYASLKVVMNVILVWHDPSGDPPLAAQLGLKVSVWQPKENSLNNRFFGPGNLTECVYICDDDMKVTEEQLIRGFQIWRGHSRRLVGFFPRRWMMEPPHYSARVHDGYNVVLTKGLYTHRYFLYMYVHLLPKKVKDVVDKYNNCEDILFNMMVTGYNGVAPLHVLVEGDIIDMGHGGGISRRGNHFSTRFTCVEELIDVLGLTRAALTIGSLSDKPLKNKERE